MGSKKRRRYRLRMPKKEFTEADRRASIRLRRLWDAEKKRRLDSPNEPPLTQEWAAEHLEYTQGAVSHYLNGRAALGVKATLKFADLLGCSPTDIREDWPYKLRAEDLDEPSAKFLEQYLSLNAKAKEMARQYVDYLAHTTANSVT